MKCPAVLIGFAIVTFICAPAHATNVWLNTKTIDSIALDNGNGDGAFIINFNGSSPDCPASGSPKGHKVKVGVNSVTENGAKNILSVAMLALSANATVNVLFDDATSDCYVRNLKIFNPAT